MRYTATGSLFFTWLSKRNLLCDIASDRLYLIYRQIDATHATTIAADSFDI
jgi:hypothetical protein